MKLTQKQNYYLAFIGGMAFYVIICDLVNKFIK